MRSPSRAADRDQFPAIASNFPISLWPVAPDFSPDVQSPQEEELTSPHR